MLTQRYRVRGARDGEEAEVAALWERCGLVRPYNPPPWDINFCRSNPSSDLFVATDEGGRIVGTVMAGHDGHRGWLYYVAVDPRLRGQGLGRRLVGHGEDWLLAKGVWKVQLMVRSSNLDVRRFYERLGYERSDVTVLSRLVGEPVPPDGSGRAGSAAETVGTDTRD